MFLTVLFLISGGIWTFSCSLALFPVDCVVREGVLKLKLNDGVVSLLSVDVVVVVVDVEEVVKEDGVVDVFDVVEVTEGVLLPNDDEKLNWNGELICNEKKMFLVVACLLFEWYFSSFFSSPFFNLK